LSALSNNDYSASLNKMLRSDLGPNADIKRKLVQKIIFLNTIAYPTHEDGMR
jgi:hypothetical protein